MYKTVNYEVSIELERYIRKKSHFCFRYVNSYCQCLSLCSRNSINIPGDFRSWESPQTLPALFIGPFEHVERFRYLKFVVKRIINIQSTGLSSSEGTAAIYRAFK